MGGQSRRLVCTERVVGLLRRHPRGCSGCADGRRGCCGHPRTLERTLPVLRDSGLVSISAVGVGKRSGISRYVQRATEVTAGTRESKVSHGLTHTAGTAGGPPFGFGGLASSAVMRVS